MNNNSSFQSSTSVESCWYKLAGKKSANISSKQKDKNALKDFLILFSKVTSKSIAL